MDAATDELQKALVDARKLGDIEVAQGCRLYNECNDDGTTVACAQPGPKEVVGRTQ